MDGYTFHSTLSPVRSELIQAAVQDGAKTGMKGDDAGPVISVVLKTLRAFPGAVAAVREALREHVKRSNGVLPEFAT